MLNNKKTNLLMIKCKANFRDNLIAASDMSPSYFNADSVYAYGWYQHGAGFANIGGVTDWNGARPESY